MMKSVIARVLKASEIPAKARVAPNRKIRLSEWEGRQHVLVHDGKHIIVRHGPESVTGTGNPALVMVCGSEKEIDAEIKRLGLREALTKVELDEGIADTDGKPSAIGEVEELEITKSPSKGSLPNGLQELSKEK